MDHILYEVSDRVAVITLNRPEVANAQNAELLDDLDAAWTRAADDDEVRVIVLRGNGKHFSSGHDLKGGGRAPEQITLEYVYKYEARRYLEYSLRWRNVPKPSIAAVQGKCIAGGLLLCWPCDRYGRARSPRRRSCRHPRRSPRRRRFRRSRRPRSRRPRHFR